MQLAQHIGHATPIGLRLGRSALHVCHHHETVREQAAVRRRDRPWHGQTLTVEVLEELGLPREISVAPGTETTDREVPMDLHAPHVVGNSARKPLDASYVFAPLPECLPSYCRHLRPTRLVASYSGWLVDRSTLSPTLLFGCAARLLAQDELEWRHSSCSNALLLAHDLIRKVCNFSGSCFSFAALALPGRCA